MSGNVSIIFCSSLGEAASKSTAAPLVLMSSAHLPQASFRVQNLRLLFFFCFHLGEVGGRALGLEFLLGSKDDEVLHGDVAVWWVMRWVR